MRTHCHKTPNGNHHWTYMDRDRYGPTKGLARLRVCACGAQEVWTNYLSAYSEPISLIVNCQVPLDSSPGVAAARQR